MQTPYTDDQFKITEQYEQALSKATNGIEALLAYNEYLYRMLTLIDKRHRALHEKNANLYVACSDNMLPVPEGYLLASSQALALRCIQLAGDNVQLTEEQVNLLAAREVALAIGSPEYSSLHVPPAPDDIASRFGRAVADTLTDHEVDNET